MGDDSIKMTGCNGGREKVTAVEVEGGFVLRGGSPACVRMEQVDTEEWDSRESA